MKVRTQKFKAKESSPFEAREAVRVYFMKNKNLAHYEGREFNEGREIFHFLNTTTSYTTGEEDGYDITISSKTIKQGNSALQHISKSTGLEFELVEN